MFWVGPHDEHADHARSMATDLARALGLPVILPREAPTAEP